MIDVVVKIGGGLLAAVDDLDRVLAAAATLARARRVLVVPGGGPFADTVREIDKRIGLANTAAHWMAVLAMDQYAHLLGTRLEGAVVVHGPDDAPAAIGSGHTPILAPYRWLAAADPLPHSWDVSSDSIAAWVAGFSGARDLVLVKPSGASGVMVDAYFERALPPGVTPAVVSADRVGAVFDRLARREQRAVDAT